MDEKGTYHWAPETPPQPKKKKPKHLQFEAERIENISAILSAKGGTADAALRRALKTGAVHHEDDIL